MRAHSRRLPALLVATLALGLSLPLGLVAPASAHGGGAQRNREVRTQLLADSSSTPMLSGNVVHQGNYPSQLAISGCFMHSAPILVTSGVDSIRVWDVSDAVHPTVVGTLPQALFENEAMNCGERRTPHGVRRFALIGVDSAQAAPTQPQHVNAGGKELIVVEVTDPAHPTIVGRAPNATTSTHTVTCVTGTDCRYAYSAGDSKTNAFSVFDLRNIEKPREVDSDPGKAGVQPFPSPTAGHKWNFDAAGYGTHTGWNGASIWKTAHPRHPQLVTTTGKAGRGTDPKHQGWNDFILHNSFRPNADRFRPHASPSFRHGNVMLATEEDYEQTDCTQAGSFQTWKVRSLAGHDRSAIVPLDKVELGDLEKQNGTSLPIPQYAFCSSHWFDYSSSGIVAVGYYGGGTQFIDARDPRHLKSFGYAFWGGSEVWDSMWVPVYGANGHQTGRDSNVVYSLDLARGLDVYTVDVPGDGIGTTPTPEATSSASFADRAAGGVLPIGLVGGAMTLALAMRRRLRRTAA
jgi:hypothetical protein